MSRGKCSARPEALRDTHGGASFRVRSFHLGRPGDRPALFFRQDVVLGRQGCPEARNQRGSAHPAAGLSLF